MIISFITNFKHLVYHLTEPDFPYLEALAPFQPLAMKVSTKTFHSAKLQYGAFGASLFLNKRTLRNIFLSFKLMKEDLKW